MTQQPAGGHGDTETSPYSSALALHSAISSSGEWQTDSMPQPDPALERRGRRPGEGDARHDIEEAARESFARDGFALTSIRSVAKTAGVDPALVRHYFRNKEGLFAAVIQLPFDPAVAVERITRAGRDHVGQELATVLSEILADPTRADRVVARTRTATTDPQGAALIRGTLNDALLLPIAHILHTDQPETRAALASSQLIGYLMSTLILQFEPLTTLTPQELVQVLSPTLQAALTGPAAVSGRSAISRRRAAT